MAATTALNAANPQLIRFRLAAGNSHIGDAGALALAKNATIKRLDVSGNVIGATGAQA